MHAYEQDARFVVEEGVRWHAGCFAGVVGGEGGGEFREAEGGEELRFVVVAAGGAFDALRVGGWWGGEQEEEEREGEEGEEIHFSLGGVGAEFWRRWGWGRSGGFGVLCVWNLVKSFRVK